MPAAIFHIIEINQPRPSFCGPAAAVVAPLFAPILLPRFTAVQAGFFHLELVESGPSGKASSSRSAPRCVGCKRVIRIAGIHQIGTGGVQ
jgi:hypothetical protein